jgi:hypothetical protein
MSDDLADAMRRSNLARALSADQCPLERLAREIGCTSEELVSEILKVVRERLEAFDKPTPSTSIH